MPDVPAAQPIQNGTAGALVTNDAATTTATPTATGGPPVSAAAVSSRPSSTRPVAPSAGYAGSEAPHGSLRSHTADPLAGTSVPARAPSVRPRTALPFIAPDTSAGSQFASVPFNPPGLPHPVPTPGPAPGPVQHVYEQPLAPLHMHSRQQPVRAATAGSSHQQLPGQSSSPGSALTSRPDSVQPRALQTQDPQQQQQQHFSMQHYQQPVPPPPPQQQHQQQQQFMPLHPQQQQSFLPPPPHQHQTQQQQGWLPQNAHAVWNAQTRPDSAVPRDARGPGFSGWRSPGEGYVSPRPPPQGLGTVQPPSDQQLSSTGAPRSSSTVAVSPQRLAMSKTPIPAFPTFGINASWRAQLWRTTIKESGGVHDPELRQELNELLGRMTDDMPVSALVKVESSLVDRLPPEAIPAAFHEQLFGGQTADFLRRDRPTQQPGLWMNAMPSPPWVSSHPAASVLRHPSQDMSLAALAVAATQDRDMTLSEIMHAYSHVLVLSASPFLSVVNASWRSPVFASTPSPSL
ncbi:hypothetical protein AURDEDRAFT_178128 [Auricularia subglabra TFB-10046 SS5]|uniref:Uncharacterized protein n=1 Tax=Auricularia subglabra (strain TFB-10046 / SS5) TaxID=717982 RepID=J0CR85_AURST|nr:hypothetical protein AURDEDRAFT_178128 [Auricularia subglabra TFB-10046 SS5]